MGWRSTTKVFERPLYLLVNTLRWTFHGPSDGIGYFVDSKTIDLFILYDEGALSSNLFVELPLRLEVPAKRLTRNQSAK